MLHKGTKTGKIFQQTGALSLALSLKNDNCGYQETCNYKVRPCTVRFRRVIEINAFHGTEHTADLSSVIVILSTSNFYCPSCFSPFFHDVLLSSVGAKTT